MEQMESTSGILNLMIQPAFTVKNGIVDQVNASAKKYLLESGCPIFDLLLTGSREYREFSEGCLYVTLSLAGMHCGAAVHRMDGYDLFALEQDNDQAELQAMALAAQELRMPLSNVMTVADQLFPVADESDDPAAKRQIAKINRGLFQLLRIVSNMSDAYRYSQHQEPRMSVENVSVLMDEIFEQAAVLLLHGDVKLEFTNTEKAVFSLADRERLERAVHNVISNAVKFSEKGSCIRARLTCRDDMLYLTVRDGGSIRPEQRGNIHTQFRRQPGLEDSRFGIGLGMVMIRSAASVHGGTVLITHPEDGGTQLTMSLAIRQSADNMVCTNAFKVDYAGERNHALIELSDVLPLAVYDSGLIN